MKIWDIRSYKYLHSYRLHRAAHSLAISQKNLLAAGFGPHVYVSNISDQMYFKRDEYVARMTACFQYYHFVFD